MFRRRPPLAVLLIGVVLAGLLAIPAVSAAEPAESGIVERSEVPAWWWDFDDEFVVVFGMGDIGEFCEWDTPGMGVPPGVVWSERQQVFAPALEETSIMGEPLPFPSFLVKIRNDEMPTKVWELDESFFTDLLSHLPAESFPEFFGLFCGWFGDNPPLAEGYTKFRRLDNDSLADVSDNNRANAYGYTANGNLVDAAGMEHRFHAVSKWVWSGDPTDSWEHGHVDISLH